MKHNAIDDTTANKTHCAFQSTQQCQVLLPTAIVNVRDSKGDLIPCRAALDSASKSNFRTAHLAKELNLPTKKCALPLQGFNNVSSNDELETNLEIHSCVKDFKSEANCIVLPTITGNLPSTNIQAKEWNLATDIQYADPNFNVLQPVDVLLGAQSFFQVLVVKKRTKSGNYPTIQATQFGCILAGTTCNLQLSPRIQIIIYKKQCSIRTAAAAILG